MKFLLSFNRRLAVCLLFSIALPQSWAQNSYGDIFSRDEIVWYGLDFSAARFTGKFTQAFDMHPVTEFDLVNTYIPAWNALVVAEPHNFDLKSTFWKKKVYHDLAPVARRNAKVDTEGLISINSHEIPKSQLQEMVNQYQGEEKTDGIGLVFIVENFDKSALEAKFWVVFFDIRTKNILLNAHCTGKPAGFGIRNYWAGAIKNVLQEIHDHKFRNWKRSLKNGANTTL